jgi:hypothetical protein
LVERISPIAIFASSTCASSVARERQHPGLDDLMQRAEVEPPRGRRQEPRICRARFMAWDGEVSVIEKIFWTKRDGAELRWNELRDVAIGKDARQNRPACHCSLLARDSSR